MAQFQSALGSIWNGYRELWRRNKLAGGIASLIFVCVICSVCSTLFSLTPTGQQVSKNVAAQSTATAVARGAQGTAEAIVKGNDRASAGLTATYVASLPTATVAPSKTPRPSDTPKPKNTPEPTDTPRPTDTPEPTVDVAADKKTFAAVDVRELKKSPDNFLDKKIVLRGEVFTIQESGGATGMQIWVSYGAGGISNREPVVVQFDGTLPDLFEKDKVVVYGRGAGTFTGTNALGGQITQPLVKAVYVDYGARLPTAIPVPTKKPAPTVPPVGKDVPTKLGDKWEITYVGEFRDKIVFFFDTGKTAFGTWATVELRMKNLQGGSATPSDDFGILLVDQDGKVYEYDISATSNARWQYCGCSTLFSELAPGQETVAVITFDVPETTKTLTIVPTDGAFSKKMLAAPRFMVNNFDQVPPFKR